jgi:hypothetical protein
MRLRFSESESGSTTAMVLAARNRLEELSSQSLLDVRVSRKILSSRLGSIDLLVDVLNALNNTAEEDLASDNLFSPNFGRSTVLMDPRRAMIGVRLNLRQ